MYKWLPTQYTSCFYLTQCLQFVSSIRNSVMSAKGTPDQIIKDLGGCGNYQMLISVITHVMKLLVCWAIMSMVILSYTPPWRCMSDSNHTIVDTSRLQLHEDGYIPWSNNSSLKRLTLNESHGDVDGKTCLTQTGKTCSNFMYDGSSIVSEVNYVRVLYLKIAVIFIQYWTLFNRNIDRFRCGSDPVPVN